MLLEANQQISAKVRNANGIILLVLQSRNFSASYSAIYHPAHACYPRFRRIYFVHKELGPISSFVYNENFILYPFEEMSNEKANRVLVIDNLVCQC